MGAAEKLCDYKTVSSFIPLNELDVDKCNELAQKSALRQYKPGERIFKLQADNNHRFYLVAGTIEVIQNGKRTNMKAGSKAALTELSALENKHTLITSKTPTSILVVNNDLLDLLLNWDNKTGYEVDEINSDQDNDWAQAILQNQTLLQLSPNNIQAIMACIEPMQVKTGQVIINQGDDDHYYYIISKGKCRVTHKAKPKGKEKLLAELGEGDAFGEEALISETKRNATITMSENGLLLRLSREDFSQFLKSKMVKYVSVDQAQEYVKKGAQWIDVRSPEEHVKNGLGLNMPLTSARIMAQELKDSRPYLLYCNDASKSSAAAFLLRQQGLEVYVLNGGLQKNNILNNVQDREERNNNLYYLTPSAKSEQNENKEDLLREKISSLESEIKSLKNAAHNELDELNLAHTKAIESLHTTHKKELSNYSSLNKELKLQLKQQKSQIITLEKILAETEKEHKSLAKQIKESEKQHQTQSKLINDKELQVDTLNTTVSNLEDKLETEKTAHQKIKSELTNQLTSQENTINTLHSTQLDLEKQITQANEQTKELNHKLDNAKNDCEKLTNEKEIYTQKLTSQESIIQDLNEQLELHRQTMDDSSELNDNLKSQLESALEANNQKDETIKQQNDNILDLNEKQLAANKQAQQAHTDLEEKLGQIQSQLEQEQADKNCLISENNDLKTSLEMHETSLQEVTKQHQQEKDLLICDYENKLAEKISNDTESETLKQENAELSNRLNSLSQDKETAYTLIDELKERNQQQQEEIDRLNTTQAAIQKKLAKNKESHQKLSKLESTIQALQTELDQTRQRASLAEQTAELLEFQLNRQQESV